MSEQLSWWIHLDDSRLHSASGHGGQYVVRLNGDHWNADFRQRTKRRRLGVVATIEEAKQLAQYDHDAARSGNVSLEQ